MLSIPESEEELGKQLIYDLCSKLRVEDILILIKLSRANREPILEHIYCAPPGTTTMGLATLMGRSYLHMRRHILLMKKLGLVEVQGRYWIKPTDYCKKHESYRLTYLGEIMVNYVTDLVIYRCV